MTVITGDLFGEICRTLWGRDWKVAAARRLERSERQLLNIETGESNLTPPIRQALLASVRQQIIVLQGYEHDLSG